MTKTIEEWEVEDFRTALAEEIGTAATERFDDLLRRERAKVIREAVALLHAMASDAERFASSAMCRLEDMPKAGAFREAARRVGELAGQRDTP